MMYKIQHDFALMRCDALKTVSSSRRSRRSHSQQFQHITCRTNYKHYSSPPPAQSVIGTPCAQTLSNPRVWPPLSRGWTLPEEEKKTITTMEYGDHPIMD
ncbi:hypothetical protein Bbelb_070230 [Branchiostoma belcheri]|nr:hypothetical protein Bbelb_070230 [Branchiostoma belcheri]